MALPKVLSIKLKDSRDLSEKHVIKD